ncbi:MAG TPA: hypothetical protein VFF63_00040 [Candidatus Babeliales bacterium]|nr:hypothetical protein [Candidatus Babeliales bacterium]
MLNLIPIWDIALAFALLVVVCGEIGYRIGLLGKVSLGQTPFAVLQTAVFGLLSLLLAFSFSLGLARYDARRLEVLDEANAIWKTILRSELLDPRAAAFMHDRLQQYVEARILFARADVDERAKADAARQSAALQNDMWEVAKSETKSHANPVAVSLFIEALNDMDAETAREEGVLKAHVPDEVVVTLAVVIAFASILLGVGFGRTKRRGDLGFVLFAIVISLVVATIVDLDRPQRGYIRVSLDPLKSLRIALGERSATKPFESP